MIPRKIYEAQVSKQGPEPAATVSDIAHSRYTIEWHGRAYPAGTKLYIHPASASEIAGVYVQADLDGAEARATRLASRLCVDALTALQTDVANANERARVSEGLFQDMNAENAQQAEQITALQAQVGTLNTELQLALHDVKRLEAEWKLCDENGQELHKKLVRQAKQIKEMRELLEQAHEMLYSIGCSPEGIDRTIAEAEALQAGITNLLERTK